MTIRSIFFFKTGNSLLIHQQAKHAAANQLAAAVAVQPMTTAERSLVHVEKSSELVAVPVMRVLKRMMRRKMKAWQRSVSMNPQLNGVLCAVNHCTLVVVLDQGQRALLNGMMMMMRRRRRRKKRKKTMAQNASARLRQLRHRRRHRCCRRRRHQRHRRRLRRQRRRLHRHWRLDVCLPLSHRC